MSKVIETTVYLFNELTDEKAKERALEWGREGVLWPDWHDSILDDWENEILPNLGFENCKVHYSGFWSQGSGASFEGDVNFLKYCDAYGISIRPLVRKLLENGCIYVYAKLKRNTHHYYHENTVSLYYDIDGLQYKNAPRLEEYLCKICDEIKENARAKMQEIYRNLEENYEYLTSDESVIEFLEINEYTFDFNGKRFG